MEVAKNPHVAAAIDSLGGPSEVARRRGLTPWAVSKWTRRLPAEHVLWLAEQTEWQYTPHQLAPALYPNPGDALPANRGRGATAVNG